MKKEQNRISLADVLLILGFASVLTGSTLGLNGRMGSMVLNTPIDARPAQAAKSSAFYLLTSALEPPDWLRLGLWLMLLGLIAILSSMLLRRKQAQFLRENNTAAKSHIP